MTDEAKHQQPETAAAAAEAEAFDVATLQAELAKAKDDMLRALADAENTRRRAERQSVEARAYAIEHGVPDEAILAEDRGRSTLESLVSVAAILRETVVDHIFRSHRYRQRCPGRHQQGERCKDNLPRIAHRMLPDHAQVGQAFGSRFIFRRAGRRLCLR